MNYRRLWFYSRRLVVEKFLYIWGWRERRRLHRLAAQLGSIVDQHLGLKTFGGLTPDQCHRKQNEMADKCIEPEPPILVVLPGPTIVVRKEQIVDGPETSEDGASKSVAPRAQRRVRRAARCKDRGNKPARRSKRVG